MSLEAIFGQFTRRDWERRSVDGSIRLAVVGVGAFARSRGLPAIDESPLCEATVLVSRSPTDATDAAEAHDVEHVIDYEAFLSGAAEDAYDAVYIATPNAFHGDYAIAAAERGKHVLCEKPLDATADRAREIVDACDRADVTLMTAYRLQVEPAVRRSRELVEDGAIGSVVQVHGSFSHSVLAHARPGSWRLDADLAGGGALVDLGIYPINTTRYILDADPTAVYATTHSEGPPFEGVDEHVAAQLAFPDGTTADCTASFDAHAHSQLQLIGTDGMISISSPFGGVVTQEIVVESGDMRMEYTGPPIDEVREEFDYFAYCVLTGTRPEPDGEDGLADLEVIAAAYESARTGAQVSVA